MKIIAFNTGRRYTDQGQRIAATLTEDGGLLFVDIDRGIDGFVSREKLGDNFELTRHDVLYVYDYQSKDWNGMEPFRHPDTMKSLRLAAREAR